MSNVMEYSKDMPGEEYLNNFKCCRNCKSWNRDITLQNDYAYNTCSYWGEKKSLMFMTPWAAFCDGHEANAWDKEAAVNEAPGHKLVLSESDGKYSLRYSVGADND